MNDPLSVRLHISITEAQRDAIDVAKDIMHRRSRTDLIRELVMREVEKILSQEIIIKNGGSR